MNSRTVGFGSCAVTMFTGRPSPARTRAATSQDPKCPVSMTMPRCSARACSTTFPSRTRRSIRRGRGPPCPNPSCTARARSRTTRWPPQRSRGRPGGRRTRGCFASTPARCARAIANTIAAITGGDPRFHHSGPYTQPSSAKRRHAAPSKRSAARTRPPSITGNYRTGAPPASAHPRRQLRARPSPRWLQRDPPLRAEPAVDERTTPQQDGTGEVPDDLHLDPHRIPDAHVVEDAEVVDRREVAAHRGVAAGAQIGAATLRERLEDEGSGQDPVVPDARVGGAHELHEGAAALADLEHAVEQQERCRVRQARPRVVRYAHPSLIPLPGGEADRARPARARRRARPGLAAGGRAR